MEAFTLLQERLGYAFKNPALMEEALTHPSLGSGARRGRPDTGVRPNFERLEFLGDAVLGLVVAEMLMHQFPNEREGDLARRQANLVCGPTLAAVGRALGLGVAMRMSEGEASLGGRDNPTNLEDACEALAGALYLDGGLKPVQLLVETHWKPLAKKLQSPPKDAKSALQEWAQARGLPLPAYVNVETTGPSHAPAFTVRLELSGVEAVTAVGNTKRAAEQSAATMMLEKIHDC